MKIVKPITKNTTVILLLSTIGLATSQNLYAQSQPDQTSLNQSETTQENDDYSLNMKNVDIHTLIQNVAEKLEKTFIVDPRVQAKVTIISSEPTDADSLYEVFLSVLAVHGFTAVEAGNLTKIVPTTVGVQSAVPIVSGQTTIQAFDNKAVSDSELVTEVIALQNVPAQQLVEILRPLLPPSASINAEAISNTITITDTAANIASLKDLIRDLAQAR